MHSRRFLPLFSLLAVLSLVAALIPLTQTPLAAQSQLPTAEQRNTALQVGQRSPGLAPALGPWAGSARGHFQSIEPGASSLSFRAILGDRGSSQPIQYQILVDGAVALTTTTAPARGFAQAVAVENTVRVSPGIHEVCLRVAGQQTAGRQSVGRQSAGRTVDCEQAVTTPPDRGEPSVEANARGVVVSPSGVVVPVVGGTTNNWRVTTPCGNTVTLRNGSFIERARIVIDAGHGGSESGAVSGRLQEKNLNLVIADLVIDKFEDLGISAQITRTGDYRLPIGTRAGIAEALAPDAFISIHHNGGAVRRASSPGTEIFYSEVRPESQRLAAILYETMHAAADQFDAAWVDTVNRGASVRLNENGDDLFGIHRFTPQIDSIITEFAYLSNPSEAALLGRADVQEAQAQSIVDGVLQWWFTNDSGTSLGRRFTDPSSSGTGGFDSCTDPSLTAGTVGRFGLSNLAEQAAR